MSHCQWLTCQGVVESWHLFYTSVCLFHVCVCICNSSRMRMEIICVYIYIYGNKVLLLPFTSPSF